MNELSVETLQKLENFAQKRSGKMDYTTESFKIPKRIEMHHLKELFSLMDMNVFITEKEPQRQRLADTATINFGKFKGTKWIDLDEHYLKWLSQNINSEAKQTALAEIQRRKKDDTPAKITKTINFGKHRGEVWDELPSPYLQWVCANLQGEAQDLALKVLKRRNTKT